MQITVEVPDALAGQLHLGAKTDLRSFLQALVGQPVAEGELTVVQGPDGLKGTDVAPDKISSGGDTSTDSGPKAPSRPQRDVLARLRRIYGDVPMTGENAVLVARRMERY